VGIEAEEKWDKDKTLAEKTRSRHPTITKYLKKTLGGEKKQNGIISI